MTSSKPGKEFLLSKESWLETYNSILPEIHVLEVSAAGQVELRKSQTAFQGWECISSEKSAEDIVLDADGSCMLDFSTHLVGNLCLEAEGGGEIELEPAEVPSELGDEWAMYLPRFGNGLVPERRWHGIRAEISAGSNIVPFRTALRYLRIRLLEGSVRIRKAAVNARTSGSFDYAPALDGWPDFAAKCDRVAQLTLRNCLHEVIEDGPKRDRRLWLGDLRLQAKCIYGLFERSELVRRCLYLHAAMLREDGFIPACVYTNGNPQSPKIGSEFIPDYAMLFGPTLLDYAEATGDWGTAAELYDVAVSQVEKLASRYADKDGLLCIPKDIWCFIDWKDCLDRQAAEQATAIYSLIQLIRMAEKIRPAEIAKLKQLREKLLDGAQKLWDPKLQLFVSGSEKQLSFASQIWMVIASVASGTQALKILRGIEKRPDAVSIGCPYLMHHYTEALCLAGDFTMAAQTLQVYWGGMIRRGCDTFWEVYNPSDDFSSPYRSHLFNSYCHAWSCTPSWFLRHPLFGPRIIREFKMQI